MSGPFNEDDDDEDFLKLITRSLNEVSMDDDEEHPDKPKPSP